MAVNERTSGWFNQARYGMFVHWGPYSAGGRGEWTANRELYSKNEYKAEFAEKFTAENYDPAEWVRLAKEAGMGYLVLTTRHHDGFCLWDTDTTDFKSTAIGAKRDLVREFADAVRAGGLKVGFYFSVADWFHPDYPGAHRRDWPDGWPDEAARRRFVAFYHAQLEELMTRYGTIDLLWYDGCIPSPTDGAEINARIKRLQPGIVINNRNGSPYDFHSCEQAIKPAPAGQDWEACMTLNESWGYHGGDHSWKNARAVIRMLTETAGNAGNLLLNVGPMADGTIPRPSADILREAGAWLRRNPGWLAGSLRSPFTWNHWGRITVREGRVYLHIFNGTGSRLRLADIGNRVLRARYLESGAEVAFTQTKDLLLIEGLPLRLADPIATTIVLEVEGMPETTRVQTSFWIPE